MEPSPFDHLFTNAPTILVFDVFTNVLVAFLFGVVISLLYRFTYRGYNYSGIFVNTLIIITMVTAIVIMVIGNNLARAFGLVGAMSIIRFRTALKDSRDIAFVFFTLAAGMAAGSGNQVIGLVGVPLVSLIILLLHVLNFGSVQQKERLLRFWVMPDEQSDPVYMPVFNRYLSSFTLLNVQSVRLGQFLELSFNVNLINEKQSQEFIRELSSLEGIQRASLVLSENGELA